MSQRDFRKPSCAEFCYIDPDFCPLCNHAPASSSSTSPVSKMVTRWNGKGGTEATQIEAYQVDFSKKKNPGDQGAKNWKTGTGSSDYAAQIEREHSQYSPFSCWGDGSGFEYDIMPDNLVGPSSSMERLYDLSFYPIHHSPLQLSDWNAWVDKFQVDYRWGQVSDQNAETILFPNVDDPWMFTEYIFQGKEEGEVVVEPPLYDEITFELKNSDLVSYGKGAENSRSVRTVANWDSQYTVQDAGGKLYKAEVKVESVKWGEHGNIPPGTLNMGAPKDWMDPGKNNATIVPKTIIHMGAPFYANSYGVVYWHDGEAYIENTSISEVKNPDSLHPYMEYSIKENGPHGVKQNTPEDIITPDYSASNDVKQVNYHLSTGDYCHGGCAFLKGQAGKLTCSFLEAATEENSDTLEVKKFFSSNCAVYPEGENNGSKGCPKFSGSSQFPILADYEATAQDLAQFRQKRLGIFSQSHSGYSADQLAWADYASNSGAFFLDPTGALFNTNRLGRPDVYNQDAAQVNIWYEIQFEVKYTSDNSVKIKQKGSSENFGKGTEVIRGSGKMALDTIENSDAFRGDTVFFGDMDQVSYSRWFETPMFCAESAYCNSTCGINMQQGFESGERAGGSGKCRYYREGLCPTNGVQKRALEFQNTMYAATKALYPLASQFLSLSDEKREEFNKVSTTVIFDNQGEQTVRSWKIYAFCSKNFQSGNELTDYSSNVSAAFGGVKVKSIAQKNERNVYLIGKLRTPKDGEAEIFFWYEPLNNSGGTFTDSNNQSTVWFCKCDQTAKKFLKNTLIITNEEKFIGGYHPQYKDYSRRGGEYLMDVTSDAYRDAMGDIIGDVDYDGQPQPVNKEGYWTDESGDYVIDERSTGIDEEIAQDQDREEPGSPTTISFRKSNTTMNGQTGESTSPKTISCAVHSNDPWQLLHFYKTNGSRSSRPWYDMNDNLTIIFSSEGRPEFEDSNGKTYWAPPYVGDEYGLPTMRLAAYCPKCDYYLSWRYHDLKCPWCGTLLTRIIGSRGEWGEGDGAIGKTWSPSASVIRKFFKLNAIGKVQIWAPAGTCIPKNGYFWKNPTVVSNTMIRQLEYRLGTLSSDGNWTPLSTVSSEKELNLGKPEQMGYYKPSRPFVSEKKDEKTVYEKITWEGITKQQREKYSAVNEVGPRTYIPSLAIASETEQFILPYTSELGDGLKIFNKELVKSLRNRLEPILAYTSEIQENGDYPTKRASFEKRKEANIQRYSLKTNCRVPSVILAANDNGVDSHVQFWSGDYEWGTVREYYPPGQSWWWLNQVIGARYSDLSGGYYHMDGTSPHSGGHRTVSKCAMFINGILPLDKEIISAYLIISPAGEPSKEPIGRGWNGHVHYDHYHANNTDRVWDDRAKAWVAPHKGDGTERHLHGQAGFKGEWDANGDYHPDPHWTPQGVTPMAEGGDLGWGGKGVHPTDHRTIFQDSFLEKWNDLCGVRDEGMWHYCGANKYNLSQGVYVYSIYVPREWEEEREDYSELKTDNLKYNSRTPSGENYNEKFKYIGVDSENRIRLNYTKDEIWQDLTRQEWEKQSEECRSTIEWVVSDGNKDSESIRTFDQYSSQFISAVYPSQMQGVAGYLNLQGVNSTGNMSDKIFYADKAAQNVSDRPIIVQEDSGGNSSPASSYSGSTVSFEAGQVTRVLDVTKTIKKLYNTRIARSFYCSAGKTLEEVSKKDFSKDGNGNTIPRWEGVSGSIKETNWNSQEKRDGFSGYVLNDLLTYPKILENNSLPEIPTEGGKYPLASKKISISCHFSLPVIIPSDRKYFFSYINSEEPESNWEPKSISEGLQEDGGVILSSEAEVNNALKEIFGEQFQTEIISNSTIMITSLSESTEKVTLLEIKNNGGCYNFFGLSATTYEGCMNRVISFTSSVSGNTPTRLCIDQPWTTNSFEYLTQNAVFDLARAPLEEWERDYRYRAPSVNISSVSCPNQECDYGGGRGTIGMLMRREGRTVPEGQTSCPGCGTDLSKEKGVVSTPGDGIYSYGYLPAFAEDPFITGIEISLAIPSSFRISAKSGSSNAWRSIYSADWNPSSNSYTVNKNGVISTSNSNNHSFNLPEEKRFRARYIQIEVDPSETVESLNFSSSSIASVDDYSIAIKGYFKDYGNLTWNDIPCKIKYVEDLEKIYHISYAEVTDSGLNIYLKEKLEPLTVESVSLKPIRFVSQINSFRAYGFHYSPEDLTMTGPYKDAIFLFRDRNSKQVYKLKEYPTQIIDLSIQKGNGGGISLTRSESKEALSWNLEERTVKVNLGYNSTSIDPEYQEKKCYAITSGNYFFDRLHNTIYLPETGRVSGKGGKISVYDLEKETSMNRFGITFYPTNVAIRYWTGSGEPITLEAQAQGQGPSWQLEKNTITRIENPENLPDNGESEAIPDMDGNAIKRPIPWVCYNHIPSTLKASTRNLTPEGGFMVPNIPSTYLGTRVDDDAFFVNRFGKNNTSVVGKCVTEVTFYGAPEKVLSGTIVVTAPATTEYTINAGGGKTIKVKERTGGIENGCFIVKTEVKPRSGRATFAYSKPTLVIYARERTPEDSF